MKKSIFFAAAALVAFAACTKNEAEIFSQEEMVFSPNSINTKALILPASNTNEDFPTNETFNVFAYADINDGNGVNYASPLMNDVEISYHAATTGGDWKATTGIYLWPATGTVDFYAYHPGSLTATFNSTADPKVLSFTGVSLGTSVGSQIDPLVATVVGQASANKGSVPLVFKHLTSQIAVMARDVTTTASLQGKISIERVVFNNFKTTGDYTDGTTAGKGAWTNIGGNNNFTAFSGSEVLATTESYLSGGSFSASIDNNAAFVVIPDNIVTGSATDQSIAVTYSIAAYSINGFDYPATPSQTVTIPLYNKIGSNKLENGKRYIFHLGLSLDKANDEITFSPQVAGWETVDINNINVDAINGVLL